MKKFISCLLCLVGGAVAGCSTAPKLSPMAFTEQALAATDPAKIKAFEPGSLAESNTIAQFKIFSGDFSAANITNHTKDAYSAEIYFRDPFKQIHGEPELEAYLLRGSGSVAEYAIDWKDVSESGGNYYFRWVMTLKLKRDGKKKPPAMTTGISFVRFGADGKVIFQQDYYDAGEFLYEKIPILGSEIRFIKKRM